MAVVRLTTKNTANTTHLKSNKSGNKKDTYFKHFVEIEDNEGNPIKIDNIKFIQNTKDKDLTPKQVKSIKNKVLHRVKQSSENRKKIITLKNR